MTPFDVQRPEAYVDHVKGNGTHLYRLACRLDLEGIVAKKADSPYEDNESDPYSLHQSRGSLRQARWPESSRKER